MHSSNYEFKHLFLAAAIGLLMLSPVFILVLPLGVANTLFHSKSQLVLYVSGWSYIVYLIGFILLSLSLFFIFLLWGKKQVFYVSLICFILAGVAFYTASQHYIAIGTDQIAYQPLFSNKERKYGWNEIKSAAYHHVNADEDVAKYTFTFNDGEVLNLKDNDYLRVFYHPIRNRLKDEGIIIEDIF